MSEQTQNQETAQQLAEEENHIIAERRAKLAALREAGVAYPNDFVRTDLFGDIRAKYQDATAEELEELKPEVACSGRMMLKRIMGKASFATVRDFTGDMQYFITKGDIGEEAYAAWKTFDLGDIVAVKGTLFRTKTGELSIRAHELRLMTKNIRPLPDKHKGLVDTEMCYRQRYVDLIMNEDSRNRFLVRSKAIAAIRSFMLAHRFLEVETPMLHPIPGGANAKPFITHHNALDMDMYLRIAPELYLKRLVVGGFERVFEINRNFRNEGVSVRHNPEFTMMEFYCTYWTYRDQMQFTEDLLRTAAREATGSAILPYQGHEIDLEKPFDRLTPVEAILKYSPDYTAEQLADEAFLRAELVRLGEPQPDYVGLGALQMALFEETTEAKLIQPTFIIDYPTEISPLARASDASVTRTTRASRTASSSSSPAENSATASPSSTTRTIRPPASRPKPMRRATVTTKPCTTTPTTSAPSSTACPRPPAAASASTASSCSSPTPRRSATCCSSRTCVRNRATKKPMDRLDSIRRIRAAELLAELRTRMQTESPESLGAFVARGLELGSLREDVMHALRTDPELRALAPEVRPRVFELFAPEGLEPAFAALTAGLAHHGLTQKRPFELLDVRDARGRIVARAERSVFRALGLATVVVRLLALAPDGRLLLQQRSLSKSIGPGLWDNLAAGLVSSGETPAEAMLRELHEEAGLDPEFSRLHSPAHLSWQVLHDVPEGRMQESTAGFILRLSPCDAPVNLDGEAAGFAVFNTEEVLSMIEEGRIMPEAARLILEHLLHAD